MYSEPFEEAVQKVIADFKLGEEFIDENGQKLWTQPDLTATGIKRSDCLEFLQDMVEEDFSAETLATLTQWAVAIGVHIERARWEQIIEEGR